MNSKDYSEIDELLEEKREKSVSTISFLAALDENLDSDTAFKIACNAFSNFMIRIYEKVFRGTEAETQERFDKFRKYYEEHAKKTPYLEIIESSSKILKVKYNRCPFYEILKENQLEQYGKGFCLSDLEFTEKLLPGVKFHRNHAIAQGSPYCDNSWELVELKE